MTIKFQAQHSRNSNDFMFKRDSTGRLHILSHEKGVKIRTALIINALVDGPKTANELTKALQSVHRSYTSADLQQPFRHLTSAGLLYTQGKGRDTTYSLGANAKARWKRATSK